jgi:GT2 family glycosyltransferase
MILCDQSDGNGSRAAALAAGAGSNQLRVVRATGRGRSRALNAGLPHARGEWVVMIDDDCLPESGWLQRLQEEIDAAGPRAVIIGRVRPGPVGPGMAPPPAILDEPEPAEYSGRVNRDLIYPNFALPRAALDELGLFDERMGVGTDLPGGEDNDFGYRLLRSGWRILYRPAPTVVHLAWRSPEDRHALKRAYGIGQGAFYAKHLAAMDPFIAYRCARDIVATTRAAGGAALRGWPVERRGHLAFLRGMFTGLTRMGALMVRGTPPQGPA